jgi:ribosomal protein L37AE/L43A
LYAKDQFKCHGCKKEKEVNGMKGVWHCNVCAFSICPECIEKTEALWQEKNVSSDEE